MLLALAFHAPDYLSEFDANPSRERINHPAWQAASHDLVFGDVMGTGNNALLLRARTGGAPSFMIVTSAANGTPVLLQQLSTSSLGVDISGPPTAVSLRDTNRDGRADLVVSADGLITAVLVADANGMFASVDDDRDKVMVAWRAFWAALDDGDIQSAQRLISSTSRGRYGPSESWSSDEGYWRYFIGTSRGC